MVKGSAPHMVAIFCPFSKFCEINMSLLSLQKQPNTAPNLFQRGVEYGKYASCTMSQGASVTTRQQKAKLQQRIGAFHPHPFAERPRRALRAHPAHYMILHYSLEYGLLLRAPGPEKHQPSIWPICRVVFWLSWLMVVRARFKLFGKTI